MSSSFNFDEEMMDNFAVRMMNDKKGVKEATDEVEYQKMFEVLRDQVNLVDTPVLSTELEAMLSRRVKQTKEAQESVELI
jgi:hypothetical protein